MLRTMRKRHVGVGRKLCGDRDDDQARVERRSAGRRAAQAAIGSLAILVEGEEACVLV